MKDINLDDLENWLRDKRIYKEKRVLIDFIYQLINEIKRRDSNDSTRI